MAETKKFLDYQGLITYDEKIKALLVKAIEETKAYTDDAVEDFTSNSLTWGSFTEGE